MGQYQFVSAFTLKKIATESKLFEFANKYKNISKVCNTNPSCPRPNTEEIENDKKDVIDVLKLTLPEDKAKFFFTDPTDKIFKLSKKHLRREDILFIYRLYLLLNKWNSSESNDITTKLKTLFKFIEGDPVPDAYSFKDGKYYKVDDMLLGFNFDKLEKKKCNDEFDKLYKEQYESVVSPSKSETEASSVVDPSPDKDGMGATSAVTLSKEVEEYVNGIKEAPDKKGERIFKGSKYTLKKKGNVISIEPNGSDKPKKSMFSFKR
jgi:hypothetical protein